MIGPKRLAQPFLCTSHSDGPKSIGYTKNMREAVGMAEYHRHFDCPRYERCLIQAANLNWQGFSCAECKYNDRHKGD